MATINLRTGEVTKPGEFTRQGPYIPTKTYDATKNNALASDVLQLIDVPAKHFVDFTTLDIVTVEGSAGTANLGDATQSAGYASALSVNAIASVCSRGNALTEGTPNVYSPVYGGGKYYTSAGVIQLVPSINVSKMKAIARAVMYDMGIING